MDSDSGIIFDFIVELLSDRDTDSASLVSTCFVALSSSDTDSVRDWVTVFPRVVPSVSNID